MIDDEVQLALNEKQDEILTGMPVPQDGKIGDIRTNIAHKGKTFQMMKVGVDSWLYSHPYTRVPSIHTMDDYLLKSGGEMLDGSLIDAYDLTIRNRLIGNVAMEEGKYIATDEIRALSADGLGLYDDDGNGIFVADGGNVSINTAGAGGVFDARVAGSFFGSAQGATYLLENTINFQYSVDANSEGWINYWGFEAGATQFRDLYICDGKGGTIAFFDGSSGRFGITDLAPTAKLHISGPAYTAANLAGMFVSTTFRVQGRNDREDSIFIAEVVASSALGIQAAQAAGVVRNISLQPYGGNVGIGTTIPEQPLHIGDVSSLGSVGKIRLETRDAIGAGNRVWSLGLGETGDAYQYDFYIMDVGIGAPSFYIEYGTGNVGIKVADPHSALEVAGAISSAVLSFSTVGPTDNVNVAGVNTLLVDTSANNVTIGGFVGGVNGQVLYIVRESNANSLTLEHIEGTGNQDIYLHAGADETLTTEYGGWILVCDGTHWHDTSHAKHVP